MPSPFAPHLSASTACALAFAALLCTGVHAGDSIRIGDETKTSIGVITDLQNGDVACYLTLKDDRGVEFNEMADFSICEHADQLRGRRVALTYAMEHVIADACQGDPECTQTQTVALVTSAKPIVAAAPAKAASASRSSLCTARETVVFACRTGAKLVSVCASADAARGKGHLQYRFGKPDPDAAFELVLPADLRAPDSAASGAVVAFSGGGGSWLRFRHGAYGYVAYSGIGRWGPDGETQEKQGVVVERDGKQIAQLKCTGALISALEPDWYEQLGIAADAADFLFPD